jgi:transcriptional regulator with XRE-family HTH domain
MRACVPFCQLVCFMMFTVSRRTLRADLLLAQNVRALLNGRGLDARALAVWCGHGGPWISKILNGERGIRLVDLGKMADFFGLTVAQLFQHGITDVTERRRHARRTTERRSGIERRDQRSFDRGRQPHSQMRISDGQSQPPPHPLPLHLMAPPTTPEK